MSESGSLDLLSSFWINSLLSVGFLICYALLKNQPLNSRVYFPRWYVFGEDERIDEFVNCGESKGSRISNYVNLNWRSYLNGFNWIWFSLRKTEEELIELVGLDSTVFVRIFLFGLKVFVPMLFWGCAVLIPVNKTDSYLKILQEQHQNLTYGAPESLSIANVEDSAKRLWAHLVASYLFTGWTCLMLYFEYATVERMRFNFLASKKQRPDQFTVLVRQVPHDDNQSVGMRIQEFFQQNHPDHYVTHQVVHKAKELTKLIKKKEKYEGKLERWYDQLSREPSTPRPTVRPLKHWYHVFWYFTIKKEDSIDFYEREIERLEDEIKKERKKVLSDQKYVMRAGFVSFDCRWAAAVCAQTQQSRDRTKWITEWAPEPRDVYWDNLAIRYMLLNSRRLVVTAVVIVLVIFFLIPVGAVQVLANLEQLIKYMPFLEPLSRWKYVESFISGFLPGAILKIFLLIIPYLLYELTKFEGHVSKSKIEKYTGVKYFVFLVVNVFFGNVLIGSLFDQLRQYIAAPTSIPKAFGVSIPKKATFFMTFIMIDGWTSIAAEVLRLWPLIWYHITSVLFVRTDKERVKVIPATPPAYFIVLPRLSLYILLGLVYAVISPLILPFLCVFFAFGFLIYRNQVMNVYEPEYESAASFWPSFHRNVIVALILKHVTLIGLFSVKRAFASTPFLLPLPIITYLFHMFCSEKFYHAFINYPLQEARLKDNNEPELDVKSFLETAYLHPSIKLAPVDSDSDDDPDTIKNGTAPNGNQPGADGSSTIKNAASTESSHKGLHDSSLHPKNPHTSGPYIHRGSSGSSGSRRRWSKRISAVGSPAFYDAGSSISSPVLSRSNSMESHRNAFVVSSHDLGQLGGCVEATDWRQGHMSCQEPAPLNHKSNLETTADPPTTLEDESTETHPREGKCDKIEEGRIDRVPSLGPPDQAPLGHAEP